MITKAKIRLLEKQLIRRSGGQRETVVRSVTEDGIYLDEEGYRLSKEEVKRIEKEDEEVAARGGQIVELTWYGEPKIRGEDTPKIEKTRPYQ